MSALTPKQSRVLQYVREYISQNERAPSTREIQKRFRLSSQTEAVNYLRRLEEAGAIKRLPYEWRGTVVVGAEHEVRDERTKQRHQLTPFSGSRGIVAGSWRSSSVNGSGETLSCG